MLNAIIALLAAVNAVFWGFCIRDLGKPVLSLDFVLRLCFNKFFIVALGSAFVAALVKYTLVEAMGVLKSGFFLATTTVVTILACYLVLGERLGPIDWIGIGLILAGVFILGR